MDKAQQYIPLDKARANQQFGSGNVDPSKRPACSSFRPTRALSQHDTSEKTKTSFFAETRNADVSNRKTNISTLLPTPDYPIVIVFTSWNPFQ